VDVSGILSETEVLPVSVVWMSVGSCPKLRYRQNEGKSVILIFIRLMFLNITFPMSFFSSHKLT